MSTPLKVVLLLVCVFSANAEDKAWKSCHSNEECAISYEKACGNFCYNKKFEKEAFEWEKNIVWDCMNDNKKRIPQCLSGQCVCEKAKILKKFQSKAVKKALQK